MNIAVMLKFIIDLSSVVLSKIDFYVFGKKDVRFWYVFYCFTLSELCFFCCQQQQQY